MDVGEQGLQVIKAFQYGRTLGWVGLVVLSSILALSATVVAQQAVDEPTAEIGFIGLHGGIYEQLLPLAKKLPVQLAYFEDERIESGKADLGSVKVLYIQHTRAEDRELYKKLFVEAKKKNPKLVVIAFQSSTAELFSSLGIGDVLTDDKTAGQYYGSSTENLRRLLVYTGKTYLGRDWKVEPPEDAIVEGFYHPDHSGKFFATAEELLLWLRKEKKILPTQPRLLIAVHGTHLVFQQPKVVDALIREAERQGAVAAAVVDGRSSSYKTETKLFQPSAIIHTCHSMDQLDFRLDLDVPHLHSIFIRKQSIDQWQQSVDGLSSSELAFHVIGQELLGAIEPQVAGGTLSGNGSSQEIVPIPDRVEHLIGRALSLAKLRSSEPANKKIAIVYYDREMGKGELMRGSSTGMHLNGPRSLLNVLSAMKEHGYKIDPLPRYEDELLQWMIARGRQVGVWAPGELNRLVQEGSPVLVPADEYRQWYMEKIPADRRQEMDAKWGPPPGKFMVWSDGTKEHIVIPRLDLGNVILLPQPLRGELHGSDTLSSQAHDKKTAPPHNYMATYFWLEKSFNANAVVHFGTHGSEFALPGKSNGLARRDWPDILMGSMPNFNPWIIENMVESSPVKRRVYGTLISHLPPPIVDAGLSDGLEVLHETIDKWEILEEGALKASFRKELTKLIIENRLDQDLKLTLEPEQDATDEVIRQVSKYLHDIQEETTPTSLHLYGEPPREDLLVTYLVQILRRPFLHELEHMLGVAHDHAHAASGGHTHASHEHSHDVRPTAEKIVHLVVREKIDPKVAVSTVLGKEYTSLPKTMEDGLRLIVDLNERLKQTDDEIENLLRGLDGRFVPPGPGNSPIRNPNAVPTGRNMYLLNPEEVPTRPSWELGKKLVDQMIEQYREKHGEYPTKYGFDLRSGATYRDYGVMEAQILYLMGVEPVWDEKGLVNDVRLIEREKLGRPRVDVFIAAGSWYESNLPTRLNLWDKAVRLVANSVEAENPVALNNQETLKKLVESGIPQERAEILSRGRIFGIAPGREMGGGLSYRVLRSGDWESREQIADSYLASHKNIFTEGAWGEPAEEAYNHTIQGTHTVVRSWSDHMTSPLASRYTWLHGGALCLAVERMTGKRPEYYFSDVRDPDKASMIGAEDALRRGYRVRLFNRKWLEGMMKEGYAGADHMRFMVSNSFAWEVMRPGSVGNDNWQEMKNVLINDKLNLGLKDWFEKNNPYAKQDAIAVMLEAIRKGYWTADEATQRELANEYAANVARHGLSGNIVSGGNRPLHEKVTQLLKESDDRDDRLQFASYAKKYDEQFLDPQKDKQSQPPGSTLPATQVALSPAPSAIPLTAPLEAKASEENAATEAANPSSGEASEKASETQNTEIVSGKQLVPAGESLEPNSFWDRYRWLILLGGAVVVFFVWGSLKKTAL